MGWNALATNLIVERIDLILETRILYFQSATFLTCVGMKLMLFFFFCALLQLFFLGGRLIFGPDVRSLVLTVCLIVTPVIFFAAAVCPQLGHEFQSQIGGWVASVAVIFTAYVRLGAINTHFVTHQSIFFSLLCFWFFNVKLCIGNL